MNKRIVISFLLIVCALCAYAEDSIKVSAADLQALIRRVERLEQKDSIYHVARIQPTKRRLLAYEAVLSVAERGS